MYLIASHLLVWLRVLPGRKYVYSGPFTMLKSLVFGYKKINRSSRLTVRTMNTSEILGEGEHPDQQADAGFQVIQVRVQASTDDRIMSTWGVTWRANEVVRWVDEAEVLSRNWQ